LGKATQTRAGGSGRLTNSDYDHLVRRIRGRVSALVPPGATVLVVTRGDEELLKLEGRPARHFPQDAEGKWLGYHPSDSTTAIAHLEELRQKGAQYILFPRSAFWWLDHYVGLKEHLRDRCELALASDDCMVFGLAVPRSSGLGRDRTGEDGLPEDELAEPLVELVDALLPEGALVAVVENGAGTQIAPGRGWLALDASASDGASPAFGLDAVREQGAKFLVIPRPAFGWLARQADLQARLKGEYRLVTRQENLAEIYELRG
jgi:hypothetical protein